MSNSSIDLSRWRLSVAPMMDWTDRHCRYFHRLLSRRALLYTEMVTTGALLHGDVGRHLDFSPAEQPLALQLGGSEPQDLAACARLAEQWGYQEINLNCGCPSERVQRGAFGVCLMAEPKLVARCVQAMKQACDLPVTVKHRIGIDRVEQYEFVRDFVAEVAKAGCDTFIVHARNAWLRGLSPKENREVPPLRYEVVYRLKREFPHLNIVLNGGVRDNAAIKAALEHVDGAMVGREAYHNPYWLAEWDVAFLGVAPSQQPTRDQVEEHMVVYMEQQWNQHRVPWHSIARHMLGLRRGMAGARRWRQVWSNHQLKDEPPRRVMELARGTP